MDNTRTGIFGNVVVDVVRMKNPLARMVYHSILMGLFWSDSQGLSLLSRKARNNSGSSSADMDNYGQELHGRKQNDFQERCSFSVKI